MNAASNFEISIGDTALLIAEVMNVDLEIVSDQQRMRPQGSEVSRLFGDNSRLRQLTGWQPVYGGVNGFRRGLARTAEWFSEPANPVHYHPAAIPVGGTDISSMLESVLEAIHQVVGPSLSTAIGLHEPDFSGTKAWSYVKDCLDSSWVSTAGGWVNRFEQQLCAITGAAHAVAVTNGTVALRLALHLVGVKPGDEVLLPPLSFVATANAVSHLGALPHFVDVETESLGLCPLALAAHLDAVAERHEGSIFNRVSGRRIAAVLPVHVFGHPAAVDQLRMVTDAWGLPLVEDAAEALSSWRKSSLWSLWGGGHSQL